jgi:hypothetical protein
MALVDNTRRGMWRKTTETTVTVYKARDTAELRLLSLVSRY